MLNIQIELRKYKWKIDNDKMGRVWYVFEGPSFSKGGNIFLYNNGRWAADDHLPKYLWKDIEKFLILNEKAFYNRKLKKWYWYDKGEFKEIKEKRWLNFIKKLKIKNEY